jgi:hypothetical protein
LGTGSTSLAVDEFGREEATVSIWRVGIVASDPTVEPQQAWRTQTVSLVWEDEAWKIASFGSVPGPTPALDITSVSPPADLFASVPRFEEFDGVVP